MLGYTIETLFFTNIWIYIYTRFLEIIRFIFPQKANEDFLILGVSPEPFEIPLYLCLSAIFVAIIIFLHRSFKHRTLKVNFFIKAAIFFLFLLLFLRNLGDYPLKSEALQYKVTVNQFTPTFYLILYLLVLLFVALELFILDKLLKKTSFRNLVIYLGIALFIAVITFPPRFVISGVDYSYFIGPVWEIIKGKTIYTEISSQYGFGSILFLSIFRALGLLPFSYIPALIWVLFVGQYLVCFHLVSKISRSHVFGFIALGSILTINFLTTRIIPTDYPQSGPLRWLPIILPLFFLYRLKRLYSFRLIFLVSILSFWMVDSGIELLMAYIFILFLLLLRDIKLLKNTLMALLTLALSLFTIFIFLNSVHLLLGYQTINILRIFLKLQQYAKAGFGMLPIENKTYFWLTMLFYFASIIYFFRNNNKTQRIYHAGNTLLLFSANLMLFALIYYVGRSHQAELYTISIFVLLNLFILLGMIFRTIRTVEAKSALLIGLSIIFIVYPGLERKEVLANSINERIRRFSQGNIFTPELDEVLKNKYEKEVKLIKKNLPDKQILIISGDDTYLFYLTDKENLLYDNSLVNILSKKDLEFSLQKTIKVCPKKIVGECRLFTSCSQKELFSKAFYAWQPIVLSEVESRCGLKYKPTDCTDQLCVALSQ